MSAPFMLLDVRSTRLVASEETLEAASVEPQPEADGWVVACEEDLEVPHQVKAQPEARGWVVAQRACALAALVALSPLFALLFVAVRATSKGPFLFRQSRRGRGGVPFTIYKVRTMSCGSEQQTAMGVRRGDAQVTRVGRVLRELKLDELPQLWNVARGDMALVGPRPLPIALEDDLIANIPGFEGRWAVRPGLTNLAQVSLDDNHVDHVTDWRQRAEAERLLVASSSLAHDLVILLLTVCFLGRRVLSALKRRRARPSVGDATEVLGVPIHNLDLPQTVARIGTWVAERSRRMVCVVPVHSLMDSFRVPSHRRVLLSSDHNTADGVPIVWAQRRFGHAQAKRVYGPDLTLALLERAAQAGWRVAFYGGHPERLKTLQERMQARFPGLQVVYAHSPPFRALGAEERASVVADLNAAEPDLVFVGLGAPKQEQWMAEHRGRIPGVLVGVGAAFDFHAGAVRQAPAFLQRCGLEWAFRLAMEPRRLWRRYATSNPAYVLRITLQQVRALCGARFQVTRPS